MNEVMTFAGLAGAAAMSVGLALAMARLLLEAMFALMPTTPRTRVSPPNRGLVPQAQGQRLLPRLT